MQKGDSDQFNCLLGGRKTKSSTQLRLAFDRIGELEGGDTYLAFHTVVGQEALIEIYL